MPTVNLIEMRNNRIKKAEELRAKGINPYPSRSRRTHFIHEITANYDEMEGQTVTVAGRLMSLRTHGALAFGHVQDQSGRIQLFIRQDTLEEGSMDRATLGYSDLHLLDIGDFIEATGVVTKTERGEISVQAKSIRLLTKSLRPLPDKWAGLKDRESILRRRYLNTTLQPDHRATFEVVSRMVLAIRQFLDSRGYLEFQTPVIQPQYGGGTARPFMTHVNALDSDMFLAISHELYLKRLIAAGFEKVYTIGRYFRNEGIDRNHQPEFSMLETMAAFENFEYNMTLVEDLFRHIAETVFGKDTFIVRGHEVDFTKPWKRILMADAVAEVTGVDFRECKSATEANYRLAKLGIREPQESVGRALAKAFTEIVEPTLLDPTFVYGHPVELSPSRSQWTTIRNLRSALKYLSLDLNVAITGLNKMILLNC